MDAPFGEEEEWVVLRGAAEVKLGREEVEEEMEDELAALEVGTASCTEQVQHHHKEK